MARNDNSDLHARVSAVLERLDATPKLNAALSADAKAFKAAAAPFIAASAKAASALVARDDVHAKIGEADGVLDASVDELADAMVGAKLGSRTKPFAGFSPYSPTKLKQLAYATEVVEVRKLTAAVAKKSPPKNVTALLARMEKNADAVEKMLGALTGPEAAYVKARTARDALLADVARALGRFKVRAKAALLDDAGAFEALFGARPAVQAPKAKRKSAKAAPAAAGDAPTKKPA